MLIPMAASFSTLNLGCGLVKLDGYLLNMGYMTRIIVDKQNLEVGSLKSSNKFVCVAKKMLHDRRGLLIKHQHQCRYSLSSGEANDSGTTREGEKVHVSMKTLIWRAIKLPIYSVALVPLTVGCAAAYLETGVFLARRYFLLFISSVFIITWLNLSNDVYDFDTGADKNKKESVVNLVGSRTGTLIAAKSLLAIGFTGLILAYTQARNIRAISLLVFAIACGYIYQCPPFRLSYRGLGEPLCFAAFGPFATTAFYLMQGSSSMINHLPITGPILSASVLVGLTTTLILFSSHFHQIEEDKDVRKMSPLVRLGTEKGSMVVRLAVFALYGLLFALGIFKALPHTCFFICALTLPMGKRVDSFVKENHKDKEKIFMAKYYCVRLHALFGAALAAGLVLARIINDGSIPRPIWKF